MKTQTGSSHSEERAGKIALILNTGLDVSKKEIKKHKKKNPKKPHHILKKLESCDCIRLMI